MLAAPAACDREDLGSDDHAARALHVARDLPEGEDGLACGHGLAGHVDRHAPLQRGVLRVAQHTGGSHDLLLGHPGDLGDALGVELGGALGKLLEAVAPLVDELVIVEVFLDDDLHHAEGQRRIGAGTHTQMQLGLRGKPGDLRIDCDDLHAALHEVDDPVTVEALEV